jgi:hypothetical protein
MIEPLKPSKRRFLAKEQPRRTAWRARSLLSWTIRALIVRADLT